MATFRAYMPLDISYAPKPGSSSSSTATKDQIGAEDTDVVQGRVCWLPLEEELPRRAVRRAHGKGVVEGIYGHPVVVISRPAEESHIVHFHVISSLQGKKLGELYNKSNDFHIRRRAWYLPIAPTPDHPDATSKNTKKRFPTLELAHGARLRSDSYVNIRHVYSIKWSLLKEYTNCEIPTAQGFRFELESTIKVLAKGKLLTKYEAETQYQKAVLGHSVRTTNKDGPQRPTEELEKSILEPMHASAHIGQKIKDQESPVADTAPTISAVYSGTPDPSRSDFRVSGPERYRIAGTPQKVPPDIEMERRMAGPVWQPADRLLRRVAAGFEGKRPVTTFDPMVIKRPMSQFWVDAKGVMAVTIASVY